MNGSMVFVRFVVMDMLSCDGFGTDTYQTSMERLDEDARASIDRALSLTPPVERIVTDVALTVYVMAVADALRYLDPIKDVVADSIEVVCLLRGLRRVHEVHLFSIAEDEGRPTLWSTLSRLRQARDHLVRHEATVLFSRLCAFELKHVIGQREDVRRWVRDAICDMPPSEGLSPWSVTPPAKRSRDAVDDE